MATALQLVNAVLRRLRENEVVDFNRSYSKLILDFVNDTKREVEDAWNWTFLRQTKTITTAAGTQLYTITGAGQRFRIYDMNGRMYDSTNDSFIWPNNSGYIEWQKWLTDTPNSQPNQYRFIGQDDNLDPMIELFPIPDGIYEIKVPLVIPEAELVNPIDITKFPQHLIFVGAWARAMAERGEDKGLGVSAQWEHYLFELGTMISMDAARAPDETIWTPN